VRSQCPAGPPANTSRSNGATPSHRGENKVSFATSPGSICSLVLQTIPQPELTQMGKSASLLTLKYGGGGQPAQGSADHNPTLHCPVISWARCSNLPVPQFPQLQSKTSKGSADCTPTPPVICRASVSLAVKPTPHGGAGGIKREHAGRGGMRVADRKRAGHARREDTDDRGRRGRDMPPWSVCSGNLGGGVPGRRPPTPTSPSGNSGTARSCSQPSTFCRYW
jgi:hypothetical protein